jgi:phage FluMu gp28-like protein
LAELSCFYAIPLDDGVNPFGLDAIRSSVQDLDEKPNEPVVWGVDLARAQDFTVAIAMDAWRRVVRVERWQAPWSVTRERVKELIGDTPAVVDSTGVGDAIVADLQEAGCMVTGFTFSQPSKLRLMQRLVAAFQGEELQLPDEQWLVAELESFEFTYTVSGVKYEAPRGQHDDGVMALGLALHGWDRVQGVPPEAVAVTDSFGDDLNASKSLTNSVNLNRLPGDYTQQLPLSGW